MSLHSGTRRALLSTQARGNGLLNALIAYWPGNEANGDALDLHTNSLHLTDVNTVTSNPGVVYPLARQYTDANFEFHTRPGNDALLSTGNVDYTLASWMLLDSKLMVMYGPCKWQVGAGLREYALTYIGGATDRLRVLASLDGTNITLLLLNQFGAPVLNTWYLVVMWYDSVADMLYGQVNNGAVDSAAHANQHSSSTPFHIGGASAAPAIDFWSGRIGPTMFWKSAPGGGGVLTAAQRTALYNGGAGLPYASFTL